jgi:hypothetical protein
MAGVMGLVRSTGAKARLSASQRVSCHDYIAIGKVVYFGIQRSTPTILSILSAMVPTFSRANASDSDVFSSLALPPVSRGVHDQPTCFDVH